MSELPFFPICYTDSWPYGRSPVALLWGGERRRGLCPKNFEQPPKLAHFSYSKMLGHDVQSVPARYRKSPGLGLGLGLVCRSRLQFKRKRLFVSSPVHPGPL